MRLIILFISILFSLTQAPAKVAGEVFQTPLAGKLSIKLRWIPPGTFTMGSPITELGRLSNETQVSVEISQGFYLAETEVTQAQWLAVMPENPSEFRGENLPVETITWGEAKQFCAALNMLHTKTGQLPPGYRWDLPTEAQWEYACRAGTTAALNDNTEITSVDQKCRQLGEVAWYQENAFGNTQPVGGKKANHWGLKDMHGNVWEWCRDTYIDVHPGGRDPSVTSSSTYVRRGGSAGYQARTSRAASRDGLCSIAKGNGLGLRLALVPVDS
jgi:formylglycine-generating enzyme required for sulfatase activity